MSFAMRMPVRFSPRPAGSGTYFSCTNSLNVDLRRPDLLIASFCASSVAFCSSITRLRFFAPFLIMTLRDVA